MIALDMTYSDSKPIALWKFGDDVDRFRYTMSVGDYSDKSCSYGVPFTKIASRAAFAGCPYLPEYPNLIYPSNFFSIRNRSINEI